MGLSDDIVPCRSCGRDITGHAPGCPFPNAPIAPPRVGCVDLELICHWYDAGTSETLCGKPVDTLFLVRTANDRWTLCKDCVDQRTEDAEHWMVAPWKAAYEPV